MPVSCHAGHTSVCKLLLEEGANIEQRNVVRAEALRELRCGGPFTSRAV